MSAPTSLVRVSRLRWVLLIPIAASGFAAAAATGHSGSTLPPPASFLGPSSADRSR